MVVLFGFKGCGKTYYGKLLAKEIDYTFIDTDLLIEERYGKGSCREILQEVGEAAFRVLESQAIASLEKSERMIISVGGGAILDPQNCERLRALGTCVYLEVQKDIVKKRILATGIPAFFDTDDFDWYFEMMYRERKPLYERFANVKIVTDGKNDGEVLSELVALIGQKKYMKVRNEEVFAWKEKSSG